MTKIVASRHTHTHAFRSRQLAFNEGLPLDVLVGWNFALSAAVDTFKGGHDGEFEDFAWVWEFSH